MNDERQASLEALRARIERVELPTAEESPLAFGIPAIDKLLQGGLIAGRVHAVKGSAAMGLAAALAARASGPVLWCCLADAEEELYMEGARQFGLQPERLILARCESEASLLAAAETSLASGAVPTTVAFLEAGCARIPGRRLQLAAQRGGGLGLVGVSGRGALAWSETAWEVRSVPVRGSRPRWHLSLVRSRRSITRSWNLEWDANETSLHLA